MTRANTVGVGQQGIGSDDKSLSSQGSHNGRSTETTGMGGGRMSALPAKGGRSASIHYMRNGQQKQRLDSD